MSYRDIEPMLECIFLVNGLAGGKGHHDGHMKGRDAAAVLGNSMMAITDKQQEALNDIYNQPKLTITTKARPQPGSENLILSKESLANIELPQPGKAVSPRAGVDIGYAVVAESFPDHMFVVSCDLDGSTKLGTAKKHLPEGHRFEMSIVMSLHFHFSFP